MTAGCVKKLLNKNQAFFFFKEKSINVEFLKALAIINTGFRLLRILCSSLLKLYIKIVNFSMYA